ncbi:MULTISPECIES: riboflavin synthase subunit alpha [unclassified Marinobacter]|jgi:riboflavin synthase|uniref:riboflavin synthase subunit alpha n=1 Tax=unclassified Marinobacter TaxID=83889 RepID=UPI00200FDF55|nr:MULTISPECIES: riboflavin synthase subunit alpha [unclassified Marinobacter]MCL1476738.1 riboflavin synthase subunit alpha [Marinobacter sp.]MCL1479843.1 riboflavin synthase subunit alpha [Marinobacter sp.]MCL1484960.1 riboflavin synthase subunit alpha [Marinobacter sp.]MCL1488099.1 riboflavin synthase subunit alpha [Marinobacter sp.]UQG57265.1 riboflavin synthase subunit alpha [Marinobacter sp. M4C]
MFTGIVQGIATIDDVIAAPGLSTFAIALPTGKAEGISIGASVAINGTCMTVTRQQGNVLYFDAMQETLRLTTLGALVTGSRVNYERAARIGDEIGGHLLSGHIHTRAQVVDIVRSENNVSLWFEVPADWAHYVFAKGYIAINGASLTIGEVHGNRFNVHLIPETLRATVFGETSVGQSVNIEIDSQTQTIVDTLARLGYGRPAV